MIDTGFSSANKERLYTQLICGCCEKDLGERIVEDGKVYDSTEDWNFFLIVEVNWKISRLCQNRH